MEDPGAPPPPPDGGWGGGVVAGKFKSINHIIQYFIIHTANQKLYCVTPIDNGQNTNGRLKPLKLLTWSHKTLIVNVISKNLRELYKLHSTNGYDELSFWLPQKNFFHSDRQIKDFLFAVNCKTLDLINWNNKNFVFSEFSL